MRNDGRHRDDELRTLDLVPDFIEQAVHSAINALELAPDARA